MRHLHNRYITIMVFALLVASMTLMLVGCGDTRDTLILDAGDSVEIRIPLEYKMVAESPVNKVVETKQTRQDVAKTLAEEVPEGMRCEAVHLDGVTYVHYYKGTNFAFTVTILEDNGKWLRFEVEHFTPIYLFTKVESKDHTVHTAERNAFIAMFIDRTQLQDAKTYTLLGARFDDSFARLTTYLESISSFHVEKKNPTELLVAVDGKYITVKVQ